MKLLHADAVFATVSAGWSGGSVQASAGSPGQSRSGRSPGYTGAHTWDSASSDPVLSDILDQVIEIVPDVNTGMNN